MIRFFRVAGPLFRRHRIVTAAAKRLAAQQSPEGQQAAAPEPVLLQGFGAVMGTRRRKTAATGQPGGNDSLVKIDQSEQVVGRIAACLPSCQRPACRNKSCSSRCTSGCFRAVIRLRGIITRRPAQTAGFNRRKLSHSNRRARLRFTESRLYFLPHITPHRRRSSGAGAYTSSIPGPTSLVPSSRT